VYYTHQTTLIVIFSKLHGWDRKFSRCQRHQTRSGTGQTSYSVVTGSSFPTVKWPKREVD